MKFSSYNLNEELVKALNTLEYYDLTSIQELSLKDALKGKSLLCKSATGSGKTHAFLIPLIQNLNLDLIALQGVIVVPTVELCIQCYNFLIKLEKLYPHFKTVSLATTKDKQESLKNLKNATLPSILVSTPGRLVDILQNEKKSFNIKIKTLVFDEADMLFEKTYQDTSYFIYNRLLPLQVLVFTATMKEHEINTIKKNLKIEKIIESDDVRTSSSVKHQIISIRHLSKEEALVKYLNITKPYFALVFCSSKKEIEKVYNYFNELNYKSYLLVGGIESRDRKALLKRLEKNDVHLLFASDVASRGIDFNDISHVISLDLPLDLDYYYHRAGRTGRNNKEGISVIFNSDDKYNKFDKLARYIKFEKYILRDNSLQVVRERTKQVKKKNEVLEQEIQREMRKTKSKIKPCYKKKRKTAVIIAKKRHKKKVIRENILARKRRGTLD